MINEYAIGKKVLTTHVSFCRFGYKTIEVNLKKTRTALFMQFVGILLCSQEPRT